MTSVVAIWGVGVGVNVGVADGVAVGKACAAEKTLELELALLEKSA